MNEYTATCHVSIHDALTARKEGDDVEIMGRRLGERKMEVFLSPEKTIEFARGLLALAGAGEETTRPRAVGDRVRIMRGARSGRIGTLGCIDESDDGLPYRVDTESGTFIAWTSAVELISPAKTTPDVTPLESCVVRAKELLAGTEHTGADVVAMARLLAGE
ncbi:hypothetical protein [Streptomyces sp. NPDC091212]|uniref:hypothetical protein n=1 Tax=Streptomyces sp. NPDC091212 TaxID=3155191 RepID=UPI0034407058